MAPSSPSSVAPSLTAPRRSQAPTTQRLPIPTAKSLQPHNTRGPQAHSTPSLSRPTASPPLPPSPSRPTASPVASHPHGTPSSPPEPYGPSQAQDTPQQQPRPTPPTCRPLPAACRRHARQPAALTAPRAAPATPRTAPARPPRRACREAPSAGAGLQLPAGSAPTLRARRGRANSRTAYGPALPPETNRVRTFCGRNPGNQDGASRSVLRPR